MNILVYDRKEEPDLNCVAFALYVVLSVVGSVSA